MRSCLRPLAQAAKSWREQRKRLSGSTVTGRRSAVSQPSIICNTRHSPGSVIRMPSGFSRFHRPRQLAGKGAAVAAVVERDVIDRKTLLLQSLGEMAHGREDEGDLLRMVAHEGRLLHHLHHQYAVLLGVEALEARKPLRQLVASTKMRLRQPLNSRSLAIIGHEGAAFGRIHPSSAASSCAAASAGESFAWLTV